MGEETSGGICPNCEQSGGPVGEPCPQPVCAARHYHRIPREWFVAARAWAARKGRPIDPLLGRRLDRYLLAGNLGEGGMGSVYLALQEPLRREVALKLISALQMNPANEARFEREARTISALDHPNIVRLYDYGIGDLGFRVPYMALEYVRHGRPLRKVFAASEWGLTAPVVQDAFGVFEQVLHALAAAHEQGIVHRDIKPDNVMVAPVHGNPRFVKVLDFGLAKVLEEASQVEVSRSGQPLGTPVYMAPEQAQGGGAATVDGRADLYAVGVMLYEILTGTQPFPGESVLAILTRKVDPAYRPLELPAARRLPDPVRRFLEIALQPRPEDRFPDANRMLQGLRQALEGHWDFPLVGLGARGTSSKDRPPTPSSPAAGNAEVLVHDGRTVVGLPGGALPSRESGAGMGAELPVQGAAGEPPAAPETRGGDSRWSSPLPGAEGGLPDDGARSAGQRRAWKRVFWVVLAVLVAGVLAGLLSRGGPPEVFPGVSGVNDPGEDFGSDGSSPGSQEPDSGMGPPDSGENDGVDAPGDEAKTRDVTDSGMGDGSGTRGGIGEMREGGVRPGKSREPPPRLLPKTATPLMKKRNLQPRPGPLPVDEPPPRKFHLK